MGYFCKELCSQELSKIAQSGHTGGSPDQEVTEEEERGCGFESQHQVLDAHFSHLFLVKLYVFLKRQKQKEVAHSKKELYFCIEPTLDTLLQFSAENELS